MTGVSNNVRGEVTIKVAVLSDGSHLTIEDFDRPLHGDIDIYCPFCEGKARLYATKGEVRAHSFRHMPSNDSSLRQCRATPNGELHLAAQIEIARGAQFSMPDFCGGDEPILLSLKEARMEVHYPSPRSGISSCRVDVEGMTAEGQRSLIEIAVHHFTDDNDARAARGMLGTPCAEISLGHLLKTDWTPADIRECLKQGKHAKWIRFPVLVKESGDLKVVCEMHPLGGMAIHFDGFDSNAYHDIMKRLKRVPFTFNGYRRNWHRVDPENIGAALDAILEGGTAAIDVRSGLIRRGMSRAAVLYDPVRWERQGRLFVTCLSLRPPRVDPVSKRVARKTKIKRKPAVPQPSLDLPGPRVFMDLAA